MTRASLGSSNRSEISGRVVREVGFVYIPFPSGTITVCTDDSPHTFTDSGSGLGSLTFSPGGIATLENINENDSLRAERATLTLGGCDSALISKCVNDSVHWLRVVIWLGYLDATGALVATPYRVFDGYLGSPTIQTGSNTSAIVITAETIAAALARVSQVRGCDADQQARFAGDTIFHQVSVNGKRVVSFGNRVGRGNDGGDGSGGANGRGPTSPVISPPPGKPLFPAIPGVGV